MNPIFLVIVLLWLSPQANQSPAAPAPNSGCTTVQSRQLDFWVGRWNVYPKKQPNRKVADNLIEKLYAGCAIRENWTPLAAGGDGGSLSAYVPADGIWRQTWLDSAGSWVEFKGRWNGRSMVMEGVWPQPNHPKQRTRMTYTPLAGSEVEQAGESSDDDGRSWQPSFDFIYRPASKQDLRR